VLQQLQLQLVFLVKIHIKGALTTTIAVVSTDLFLSDFLHVQAFFIPPRMIAAALAHDVSL
jgi:hypothetical protein